MNSFLSFFTQMDKQAFRAIAVMIAMFAFVILILLIGGDMLSMPETEFHNFFQALQQSPWGLPLTILTFTCAAFLGAPQWALIAGVVLAFGPVTGSFYAWLSTMISATVDFWLGRWMGAEKLRQYGGDLVNRITSVVQNNGFFTSLAVRFVPTGPFVLVNMAAGVSGMKYRSFAFGTGLGIVPKIAVVGLVARGLLSGSEGESYIEAFIGLAVMLIVLMMLARYFLKKRLSA